MEESVYLGKNRETLFHSLVEVMGSRHGFGERDEDQSKQSMQRGCGSQKPELMSNDTLLGFMAFFNQRSRSSANR